MASTPHMNPPSTPAPTSTKDVSLPHMPPKPEHEVVPSEPDVLADTTKAEQEAGRAAVAQAKKRTQEEQAAGTKASEQHSKRV